MTREVCCSIRLLLVSILVALSYCLLPLDVRKGISYQSDFRSRLHNPQYGSNHKFLIFHRGYRYSRIYPLRESTIDTNDDRSTLSFVSEPDSSTFHAHQLISDKRKSVESLIKTSIIKTIQNSWSKYEGTIELPVNTLVDDLKDASSVLALATLKKLIGKDPNVSNLIKTLACEGDINLDSSLAFTEWNDWLYRDSTTSSTITSCPAIDIISYAMCNMYEYAMSSLQLSSRISQDPALLKAAYIGGGILSGAVDTSVTSEYLSKISESIHEIISQALALERSTRSSDMSENNVDKNITLSKNESNYLQTLKEWTQPLQDIIKMNISQRISSSPHNSMILIPKKKNPSFRINSESIEYENNLSSPIPAPAAADSAISQHDNTSQLSRLWGDISKFQSTLQQYRNQPNLPFNKMMEDQRLSRGNVLDLAMCLRSTRLRHSFSMESDLMNLNQLTASATHLHQLAHETIDLWTPLSYALGVAKHLPELETLSLMLLFPTSFKTFLDWYDDFIENAENVMNAFRVDLVKRIRGDSVLSKVSSKVTVQSRLKTPSSAFKKLVQKQKMNDLIGLRIIVSNHERHLIHNKIDEENIDSDEKAGIERVFALVRENTDWSVDEALVKDYIAKPKQSGYQSLHATLLHISSGARMEVQIRSSRMHLVAEHGSAAHRVYKAITSLTDTPTENKIPLPSISWLPGELLNNRKLNEMRIIDSLPSRSQ